MDYFIAGEAFLDTLTSVPASEEFSEQVVQLAGIGAFLFQPILPEHLSAWRIRESLPGEASARDALLLRLGLPVESPLLVCVQVSAVLMLHSLTFCVSLLVFPLSIVMAG